MAAAAGALAWPAAASAQQSGRLPVIGFLGADPAGFAPWTAAFVARLGELGWVDGRNVTIAYRWSEGRTERYAEIAAEFVRDKVDVIVTVGSAVPIVRQATSAIPIVFAVAIDPVRSGLVANMAQPGGNVTGLSLQATNLAGKRLEILRELIPQLRRLAVIFNGGNEQTVLEMSDTEAAARDLKLDVARLDIRGMPDIATVFEKLNAQADALYVVVDQLIVANFNRVLTFALSSRLPMIYARVISSDPEGSCRTGQGTWTCFDGPLTMCIGFCRARNREICRSNSRRASNSSLILRQQGPSVCASPSHFCCASTR